MQLSIASTELYLAAMCFVKFSLALFYLKHIEHIWQRYTTIAAATLNIASSSLMMVLSMLECGVLSPGQAQSGSRSVCLQADVDRSIELSTSISNTSTSWTLAIIPIFIIASRSERISTALKLCTGGILLLGGCASVISVLIVICTTGLGTSQSEYLVPLCVLECGLAITAASAATFRPLFRSRSTSAVPDYIDHAQSETSIEKDHEQFAYEFTAPSKSHFSLFSEASFGPRTWFKGLHESTASVNAAEEVSRTQCNKGGASLREKSIRKLDGRSPAISRPIVTSSPRLSPPPLNRTESQQYLLRNQKEQEPEPSLRAARRYAGSPNLFLTYEPVEWHM